MLVFLLCCLSFGVHKTLSQNAVSTTPMTMADKKDCPLLFITPRSNSIYTGKNATFVVTVEAKVHSAINVRWQKYNYYRYKYTYLNITERKYQGTALFHSPQLVINDAEIEDNGHYRIFVRITEGWCVSYWVHLEVLGTFRYHEPCYRIEECDYRKYNLECSAKYNECLCSSSYYQRNQICYSRSNLEARVINYNVTTSVIGFSWGNSSRDDDLVTSYRVELTEYRTGHLISNVSVGTNRSYYVDAIYIPGNLYSFSIISTVVLSDPSEKIFVRRTMNCYVEPLPPGPIDRKSSDFHPEHLNISWEKPGNNTVVGCFYITIDGFRFRTDNNVTNKQWPRRLMAGEKYIVSIQTHVLHRCRWYNWYGGYGKGYSVLHQEEIKTLKVPIVYITSNQTITASFRSTLKITGSIQTIPGFPKVKKPKWQKLQNGTESDIDITETRYKGSTTDLFNPVLVINGLNFDQDNGSSYQLAALNSEGWGRSLNVSNVTVIAGLRFMEQCNMSIECVPNLGLECRNNYCLCSPLHYHKDMICYDGQRLQVQNVQLESSTCNFSLKWEAPETDKQLVVGYYVVWEENRFGRWVNPVNVSVGNNTEFQSECSLMPGRFYRMRVRVEIRLTNPDQTAFVESLFPDSDIILEPLSPGPMFSTSNYSADNLYLKWSTKDRASQVNRFKVIIDGHTQVTNGNEPEIHWNKLLEPYTEYNVTIIAISFGYAINYPLNGSRESHPSIYKIVTEDSRYSGKAFLPYGKDDRILIGDDVISDEIKLPIAINVGNGSISGFKTVTIGSNGLIGLGKICSRYIKILKLDSNHLKEPQMLCPFWTDLLSNDTVGKVYYNSYERINDRDTLHSFYMDKADNIVKKYFKDFKDFSAIWVLKVTWENMTMFADQSERITVQCLLIADNENTFTVMNYIDVNLNPTTNHKISIGYRYKNFFRTNMFSLRKGSGRMSKNPGNRGEPGVWVYKMTEKVKKTKDEGDCTRWYLRSKRTNVLSPSLECPCDSGLLRFDPRYEINRFDSKNRLLCYASLLMNNNVECCYKMYTNIEQLGPLERSQPLAGTVLKYNPFFERSIYTKIDLIPKTKCCESGHCDWYYKVRKIPRCYVRSPFQPGVNFGDPHITTLDGLDYTFNGYGEYILLTTNTGFISFDLQARTDLVTTENGTFVNATVFSAFVAKDQTGSIVQVELSKDKTSMIIHANKIDLTASFRNQNFSYRTQNLSMRLENDSISATFLKSDMNIKISIGERFLVCETLVNDKFKNKTRGLMGNFDGNKFNDFVLPNGTILEANKTKTERQIFYSFGQLWSVFNSSLFEYDDGLSHENFSHPDFIPIFAEENKHLKDAKTKCGGDKASKACIFDYLATGDTKLAKSSGNKAKESINNREVIENESPQLNGNTTINVEINKEVTLVFNATDDGKDSPSLIVLEQPYGFHFRNATGIAKWTPLNDSICKISLIAEDTYGARSPSFDVVIRLCPGCKNGKCHFESVLLSTESRFYKVPCECNTGYTGEHCDEDIDGCQDSPCPLGRNCTDLTPEEEVAIGRGYNCSACPGGYDEMDNKCKDINECLSSEANDCKIDTEVCENLDGGYVCNCIPGYRKQERNCIDIDECIEMTSGCEHLCTNTAGSFSCSCYSGYTLDQDGLSCNSHGFSSCNKQECEYACVLENKIEQCFCPLGYQLSQNGVNCSDVNECNLENMPCEELCNNTKGSFQCSCNPGYKLNEDKTSCSECELPSYGKNCNLTCRCGQGADTCDVVSGCVCKAGWTGINCDLDLDECVVDPNLCGLSKLCVNNEGSYECVCQKGFHSSGEDCKDIDECVDDSLNDCPYSTTYCQNTYGSYTCECDKGYKKNGSKCEDINECKTNIAGCSQICKNADGGYSCGCYFGFTLDTDQKHCIQEENSCSRFPGLNCSYGCRVGHDNRGICFCEDGYELSFDNRTCTDINECSIKSTCEHNCTNTDGSYECSCCEGFKLQNDGQSCQACPQFRYGEECSKDCRCNKTNSEGCDAVTGNCLCKGGWTGSECTQDVDECKSGSKTCDSNSYQICVNTIGSSYCECLYGGVDITNCNHPFSPPRLDENSFIIRAEITFGLRFDKTTFNLNFKEMRQNFKTQLEEILKKDLYHQIEVTVISIRLGSVIVDFEIRGAKAHSSELNVGVAKSMSKLLRRETAVVILNQRAHTKEITVKYNGTAQSALTKDTDLCTIFNSLNGCETGLTCDDSSGEPICKRSFSKFTESETIKLSFGIGIPLLIVTIIMILLWKPFHQRHSKCNDKFLKERAALREDTTLELLQETSVNKENAGILVADVDGDDKESPFVDEEKDV